MALYLDTSALVKLVVAEPETEALRAALDGSDVDLVTCDLARTELYRAVRRAGGNDLTLASQVLHSVAVMVLSTNLYESAGRLDPVTLRSLDAIHLAAAMNLGDDLEAIVTYDDRMAEAARRNGLPVIAPG